MGQIGKFRTVRTNNGSGLMFYCPGCEGPHTVTIKGSGAWTFNGNYDAATFNPSLLTTGSEDLTDELHKRIMAGEKIQLKKTVCHLFLINGILQFLSDCTHKLKGQSVPLPELPDWLKD